MKRLLLLTAIISIFGVIKAQNVNLYLTDTFNSLVIGKQLSVQLNQWKNKGYIKKIIDKYYYFSDIEIDELFLFFAANKIYSHSYISFETALAFYNLIPESVYIIRSASARQTYIFQSEIVEFQYTKTNCAICNTSERVL